jgi:hypothetical protein
VPLLLAALGISVLACFMSLPSLLDMRPAESDTASMGHMFYPEMLCGQSGSSSSRHAGSTVGPGCSDNNDLKDMDVRVTIPPGLQLLSGDADLVRLQQQLIAAVAEGWHLPIARNLPRVLLAQFDAQEGTFNAKQAAMHAKNSRSSAGYKFLAAALSQLADRGDNQFVACSFDPSLPIAFSNRFLFSVSLGTYLAAHALPNMLLQLLHVALLLEPGLAYISIHAAAPAGGRSSSELLVWLDLLQLLLVPLGVPLHLVVDKAPHSAEQYCELCSTRQECSCGPILSMATGSSSTSNRQKHSKQFTPWQAQARCASPSKQPWQHPIEPSQQQRYQCKRQHSLWQLSSQQARAWLFQA